MLEEILDDGLVNFLFVGRIAPNKKIEDHIKLAEQYKRYIDAYYRFIFVGRYDVVPRYYAAIRALMAEYKLLPERFIFTGPVPDAELAAYYRASSVYISLSEHEGFCVPLVEAMAMDVPVLAYSAAAVPDTLGGAGVQFAPKDLEYAAELLGMLAFEDEPARGSARRPAAAAAGFRRRRHSAAARLGAIGFLTPTSANRLHRPTIRNRDSRRRRIRVPSDGRAARRAARRRGADDVRAGLRDVEERVSRRAPIAFAASPSAVSPTPRRATSRTSTGTRTGSSRTRTTSPTRWSGSSGRGRGPPA